MSLVIRIASNHRVARRTGLTRSGMVSVGLVAVMLVAGFASIAVAETGTTAATGKLLSRRFVVPLSLVRQYFPRVTQQKETGKNSTSSGKPVASRQVIYANLRASKRVTLSVDRYTSVKTASTAFQEAARKTRKVKGFSALRAPKIGERSSAGTVTQGDETHVGIAALQGSMIIQATIAGFDATRANIAKIVGLTRREVATAKGQCARQRGCIPVTGAGPGDHLYWTDELRGDIMEANIDGTDPHAIVTGQVNPVGVAVNGSHLYWTNSGDSAIEGEVMGDSSSFGGEPAGLAASGAAVSAVPAVPALIAR